MQQDLMYFSGIEKKNNKKPQVFFSHHTQKLWINTKKRDCSAKQKEKPPNAEQLHSTTVTIRVIRAECHILIWFSTETKYFMNNRTLPFRITVSFFCVFNLSFYVIRKVPLTALYFYPLETEMHWHIIYKAQKRLHYQFQVQDAMNWHL